MTHHFSFSCFGLRRHDQPELHLLPIINYQPSCRTVRHQDLQVQHRYLSGKWNCMTKTLWMTSSEFENLWMTSPEFENLCQVDNFWTLVYNWIFQYGVWLLIWFLSGLWFHDCSLQWFTTWETFALIGVG